MSDPKDKKGTTEEQESISTVTVDEETADANEETNEEGETEPETEDE